MKRIHLLFGMLGCAAFALAGFGVGALLGTSKVTTATDSLATDIYLLGSFNSWTKDDSSKMYFKTGSTYEYYLTQTMAVGATFKVFDNEHPTSGSGTYVNTLASSVDSSYFSVQTTGDTNVECKVAGTYKITYTYTSGTGGSTYLIDLEHYAVSEYRVVDGTAETSAFQTEKAYPYWSFSAADAIDAGHVFGGWYTDSACQTAYTATTFSGDATLYAKFTSVSTDPTNIGYVYFSAPKWTDCYMYTFGKNLGDGAWPGTKITATNGVTYQGSGVYRGIYYKDAGDTGVIFNNGTGGVKGTTQTNDLTIAEGYFYTLSDASTGDLDKGSGAAVVYDINIARQAVAASGEIAVGSICGVSKAKATELVAEYDALNATAKGYVDAATDYTYDGKDTTKTNVNVPMTAIVAQLRSIATAGSSGGAVTLFNGNQNHDSTVVIIMVTAAMALFTAGSLLVLKRKKRA